ncbi:P-loop containing nucleoside triphosphate hydrolase protein [Pavlovales sp. CCMP2436]|nr:P-loop containing nucleoside triphosphate hydrolase protein [Pavlovales sp. CCMP2436]|mmetsp:Transcript_45829/g.107065  ORF Transcript_45829/g.107065 Transcript_45829/m.107065 type:complete len:433 (+) Transcript_45829:66-1364(+)
MFGLVNNAVKAARKKQEKRMTVILLGIDNAGKTTLLHTLKVAERRGGEGGSKRRRTFRRSATVTAAAEEPPYQPRPTIGFDETKVLLSGLHCTIYDVGGSRGGRSLWPSYLDEVHAVVFVVDAADAVRLEEAKEVVHATLAHEKLRGKPVLFLANKQDAASSLSAADLSQRLGLHDLHSSPHQIHPCSASQLDDSRLFKAFKWLGSAVAGDYAKLQTRVNADVAEKKVRDDAEREARRKRIADRKAQRAKDDAEAELAEKRKERLNASVALSHNGPGVLRPQMDSIAPLASASAATPAQPANGHAQLEMQPMQPASEAQPRSSSSSSAQPPSTVAAAGSSTSSFVGRASSPLRAPPSVHTGGDDAAAAGSGVQTVPSTPSQIAVTEGDDARSARRQSKAGVVLTPVPGTPNEGGNPVRRLPSIERPAAELRG